MKKYIVSGIIVIAVLLAAPFAVMESGVINVSADVTPPAWEAYLMPMVLRASITHHAPLQPNPVLPTEANLIAGAEIYSRMCAGCHGRTDGKPSVHGAAFYPPAPQLPGRTTTYTEAELFWIIEHGIRNTGMPWWGRQLSEDDIWHLAALVKGFGHSPVAVKGETTRY